MMNTIFNGYDDSIKEAFRNMSGIVDEWNLTTQKKVRDTLSGAFERGGSDAVTALQEFFNKNSHLTEEEMAKIADASNKIDWTSSGAMNEFQNILYDLFSPKGSKEEPDFQPANEAAIARTAVRAINFFFIFMDTYNTKLYNY